MNIIFKKIRIHNFMSFEEVDLDLNKTGYYSIHGINNNKDDSAYSNGSGKSSLFEALCWVLTGETVRGTKNVSNLFTGKSAEVELDFTIDKTNFKIIRKKSPSTLSFFVDGEDKSGKGIRDTEKIVEQYIPDLSINFIGSVILLGQGLPQRFTNNSPSGRKEVLEKLSKSNFMIEELKVKVSARKKELNENIRKIEDALLVLNVNKNHNEQELESLKNQLNNIPPIEMISKSLEELKITKQNIEESCNILNNSILKLEKELKEKDEIKDKLESNIFSEVEKVRVSYDNEINEHVKSSLELQQRISSLNEEINKLEKIVDVCPTCGQKIKDIEKPDTEPLKEVLNDLLKDKKVVDNLIHKNGQDKELEIQKIKDKMSIRLEVTKKTLFEVKQKLNNDRNLLTEKHESLYKVNADITLKQNELDTHTLVKNNIIKAINDMKISIEEIDNEILYKTNDKENLDKRLSIINKIFSALNKDFRGYLLTNVIEYINKVAKVYCNQVYHNDKLDFVLDGNNISISYCGKEYENLSGGEKQKIDIIIQFAIRQMLSKYLNFSSNLLVLDEVTDFLDEQGVEAVFNLITNNLKDVPSIYFITHHEDLMFPYDGRLTIIKNKNGISSLLMS